MHDYNISCLRCHDISDLDTNWQNVDLALSVTIAGRYIARKYDVPTAIADALAVIAGLGPEAN